MRTIAGSYHDAVQSIFGRGVLSAPPTVHAIGAAKYHPQSEPYVCACNPRFFFRWQSVNGVLIHVVRNIAVPPDNSEFEIHFLSLRLHVATRLVARRRFDV